MGLDGNGWSGLALICADGCWRLLLVGCSLVVTFGSLDLIRRGSLRALYSI
jgi:hypothetical protein